MANRKETEPRACGYCLKVTDPPHNARTCKVKKRDIAAGKGAAPEGNGEVVARPAAVAVQPVVAPMASSTNAVEFEEVRKQVQLANGQTMVGSLRRYSGGWSNFVLRSQPKDDPQGAQSEQVFDIESAAKLYELLGWCLQQHQTQTSKPQPAVVVRASQNGLPHRVEASEVNA